MAAFLLITFSVGVDLYQVGLRCWQSGISFANFWTVLRDFHDEVRVKKYLECIDEIYEWDLNRRNSSSSDLHRIGIPCVNCRRRQQQQRSKQPAKMMCDTIENAIEVDGCEEAFEIISNASISESQSKLVCNSGKFNLEVPVQLQLGTSIYVSGTILKNCEGFAINLTLGHLHNDIALHINPRIPQNYIVRNSKINGRWGKEETTASLPFKLKRDERFAIQILVTESTYLISVNGLHFTTFAHRVPFDRVTCVQLVGDVIEGDIQHLPIKEYPERSEQSDIVHNIDLVDSFDKALIQANTELVMPYYGKLLSKLINGSRLHIVGRVKVLPYSFYINLQQSDIIWPHPTIPFHFNVRFTTIGGKNIIVKNSWTDGKWDREERSEIHTDFMPSRTFHLQIIYNSDAYHVFLNDKLITEFVKRTDPTIVDTVYIYGDIKLKHVSQEREKCINLD